ncbi:uncharacterized protein TRIADDRAFT_52939 [Trichoplax adhaerens]|uniref:Charged multivesicular body protein 6 n=1 Tax=Trichoplax adhaerens TaxID=10228 RepID=B3RMV3_TRIAD|nr:hypothetical protein TRIADDRAFT_52939 [Trichoplax adhaerens]EDV27916.1 hypothetical protein TRIADDRAFT_52939 [Trichoplax adhaerens]|eukprot:XP_002109750.1 hypothetical protein TRIADDRAFT_52939 [Trichoplax adhaerens]
MGALFGKSKPKEEKHQITEQDRAVLGLKQQRDKLQQYQKRIKISLEQERAFAKDLVKQKKVDKAKLLLKKKRYYESLLEKTDGQLDGLERMVNDVEFAKIQVQVVERLKQGNECLDRMHKMMSIEDVERIMDETQEAIEYQKQIDELLGNTLTDEDETAVLAELEQITQQELQNLPDVPAASLPATTTEDVELPDVPTEDPGVTKPCSIGII